MNAPAPRPPRLVPLRWHLLLLVVGTLAPVAVFAGAMLYLLAEQERRGIERRLVTAAETMADRLDREVAGSIRALEALAQSRALEADDLSSFYVEAQRVVPTQPRWLTILLLTPDGRRVLDTKEPYGAELPLVYDPESLRETIELRRPTVGSLKLGKGGSWAFPIRVPVLHGGAARYALTAVIDSEALAGIVATAAPDEEWTRAVVDARGTVAARTRDSERFVGQPATDPFVAQTASAPRGLYRDRSLDDRSLYVAFARSPLTGWSVAVTSPVEYVDGPVRRSIMTATALGTAVILLSALSAWVVARRVAGGIGQAAEAALAITQDRPPRLEPSPITEIARLADALECSGELLRHRARQRDEHLARAEAAGASLRALNATLEQRVDERTAQLRALATQLTAAEERERRRIAQALHDHLQQVLVAAKMRTTAVSPRAGVEDVRAALARVGELIDASIDISRTLTVELSPPVLYDVGLAAALRWLARNVQERHGLTLRVEADPAAEPSDQTMRAFLFHAARELIFNAVKHAGVDAASVRLALDHEGCLLLEIADAGKGFAPAAVGAKGDSGFGLFSIRERLAHLGGRMTVESSPGAGTRITLTLPREPGDELCSSPGESAAEDTTPPALSPVGGPLPV